MKPNNLPKAEPTCFDCHPAQSFQDMWELGDHHLAYHPDSNITSQIMNEPACRVFEDSQIAYSEIALYKMCKILNLLTGHLPVFSISFVCANSREIVLEDMPGGMRKTYVGFDDNVKGIN